MKHYVDSLSVVPGIAMGIYRTYCFLPSPYALSSASFTFAMCFSYLYHYYQYNHPNKSPYRWLRYDLTAQLITGCITTYFTEFGANGTLAIAVCLLMSLQMDLADRPQRLYAYTLNGIACLLSAGAVVELWMYWMASFMMFSINLLIYENPLTHGIFHLMTHHICWLIWNQSFIGDTGDHHGIIERYHNQTHNGSTENIFINVY